jgi:acetyl esterase
MPYAYDPELMPLALAWPDIDITDVPRARELLRQQTPPFTPPGELRVEKRTVPGPPGDPDIEVCVMTAAGKAPLAPAVCWIHGGGFVLGEVDGDLDAPAHIAVTLGAVAVSVEYRLAPEHPYPAPVQDCYAGLTWLAEHAKELGIDPSRIAIAGVSAGGGLAAAVALMARDRGGPALCLQVLDIPELDDRLQTPSMLAYTDTPCWNYPSAILSWQAYLGAGRDGGTPAYAAPARAADLSGLPPAYVVTCEFDPLRDEGIDYAQRLMRAGVATELHHYPGTFHGSCAAAADSAISKRMVADRTAALARAFGHIPRSLSRTIPGFSGRARRNRRDGQFAGAAALTSVRGQPVDAFAAAAGPRAARRAGPPAGAAPDAPLELAALELVPRHQLAAQADHAHEPAVSLQQELAVDHFGLQWFHGASSHDRASRSIHGTRPAPVIRPASRRVSFQV